MSEIPPKVANWLFNILQPQYIHKQLAYTHIYQFLAVYLNHKSKSSRFKIKTDVYTSGNSGQSSLLVDLYGSIKTSNDMVVPVHIWVPLSYPYSTEESLGVPIVYIIPNNSKNYYLKPGNHIDSQGRFYHPYLSSWLTECVLQDQFSLSKYNLIELVKILKSTFEKEPPIYELSQNTNDIRGSTPLLRSPQKPAKIPIQNGIQSQSTLGIQSTGSQLISRQTTGSQLPHMISRQTTGPPIPQKPHSIAYNAIASNTIPSKYQNPLPLPPLSNPDLNDPKYQKYMESPGRSPNSSRNSPSNQQKTSVLQQQTNSTLQQQQNITQSQPQREEDLMDKNEALSPNAQNDKLILPLRELSRKINACLQVDDENSINFNLPTINANNSKINALYTQLSYHNTQAKANSEILEDHVQHLNGQVSNISKLIHELTELDQINSNLKDSISTSINNTPANLDDIIIADLALVNQLYEVVSEIKSNKDIINLIGGSFQSQSELINDDSIDVCVKHIRSIGRDTFWLELTKLEIARTMNLSN